MKKLVTVMNTIMIRKLTVVPALLGLVALIVSACAGSGGSSGGSDESNRSSSNSSTASTTSLRVTNYTSRSILYLYISPSSQNLWGIDQLREATIGVGESFTLHSIPCGENYDVKAKSSLRSYYKWDQYFECGYSYYWNISSSSSRTDRENQESATTGNEKESKPESRPTNDTEIIKIESNEEKSSSATSAYQISED